MTKASLLDAIEADRNEHITFLQSFLRAPSPNPPGDTRAVADVLFKYLSLHQISPDLFVVQEDKPNVIAEYEGSKGPGRRLIMNGHMDVFPVVNEDQWKHGPWSGDISNGRIFARGAVDMKAGTAASVVAFAYLYRFRQHLKGTICLSAVSDEETGGKLGTAALLEKHPDTWLGDCVLNAEPSSLHTVRFGEKGTLRMTFTVETAGALGAYLHYSKGAIRLATSLIDDLLTIEDLKTDIPDDLRAHFARGDVRAAIDKAMGPGAADVVTRNTVNIGTINGGAKVNMIPESCIFEADIRLPIGSTKERVLDHIDGIIRSHMEAEKVTISYQVQQNASNPPNSCAYDHEMIDIIANNTQAMTGERPLATPGLGGTDCKFWRYRGVPAFVIGGSPEGMAATDESFSLEEYLDIIKIHAASAWDYLSA